MLHPFLQQVFGPQGVLSLRVLVFGDFPYDGRYDRYCKLLCRSGTAEQMGQGFEPRFYREMTERDRDLLNLLEEHNSLITACPMNYQDVSE